MTAVTYIQHLEASTGNVVNFTFSNIPQIHTDLILVTSLRSNRDAAVERGRVQFNGDTATNYSYRTLIGTETSFFTEGVSNNGITFYAINGNTSTASSFSTIRILIPNYSVSGQNKVISLDGAWQGFSANSWREINTGTWNGVTPITSISLIMDFGNVWMQHSSATLYGVAKGSSGGVTVS